MKKMIPAVVVVAVLALLTLNFMGVLMLPATAPSDEELKQTTLPEGLPETLSAGVTYEAALSGLF